MRQAALSRRELVVLAMYVNGACASEISGYLSISIETVKGYIKRGIQKYREIGFVGPSDKLSLGVLLNAEPRTWFLSGYQLTRRRSAA